jgi:hypothetical protein
MPEYKNQHYVPQFYLRAFSFDGGKSTALLNLKQNKVISAGKIVGQCSEDYFYGRNPEVEKDLSASLEAPASKVIADIIKSGTLPKPYTEDYAALFIFGLFQHGRTLYASKEGTEFFQAFVEPNVKQLMLKSGEFTSEDLRGGPHSLDHEARNLRWTLLVCCHL